jgi:hypothetical protein
MFSVVRGLGFGSEVYRTPLAEVMETRTVQQERSGAKLPWGAVFTFQENGMVCPHPWQGHAIPSDPTEVKMLASGGPPR